MKAFLLSAAVTVLVFCGSPAWAVKFSVGGGQGQSLIMANGTGDYLTLAEAAADFTGHTGGATGNWTLLIGSDLQETEHSLFGNNTNGHTVTVRPAPATSVTVTFNMNARPTGGSPNIIWDGNIVIGPSRLRGATQEDPEGAEYMEYRDVDNFIIDGCNTVGGTARNLTLLTPESAASASAIPRFMVRVIGRCDNSVIRNTTINCNVSGSEYFGIYYTARFVANGGLLLMPHNATVSNCAINVPKGNSGRAVMSNIAGSAGIGRGNSAINGMMITNCDILSSHRAIQFAFNAGGKMIGNRIRIVQESASSNRPEVLIHTGSNDITSPFVTDMIGNHISEVHTASTTGFNWVFGVGCPAVDTFANPSSPPPTFNPNAVYNISNNMVGGFRADATITNPASWLLRMIALENSNVSGTGAPLGGSMGTINVRHNSFNMEDIPNFGPPPPVTEPPTAPPVDSSNRLSVVSFLNANGFAGGLNFENNIVRYGQHMGKIVAGAANPSAINNVTTTSLNFNNNTYFLGAGALFAHLNGVAYPTLANWQAGMGDDLASNIIDPLAPPSGGKWKSNTDQHFDGVPAAGFTGVLMPSVVVDIDGDVRPVTPTKGADEYNPNSSVNGWSLY